jgi:hypothetical protein
VGWWQKLLSVEQEIVGGSLNSWGSVWIREVGEGAMKADEKILRGSLQNAQLEL